MAKSPHFDISAAVVRQLGDELVSDEITAIVELVKNAYDADATYAHVVVNTADAVPLEGTQFPKAKGYITIEDDGFGMSRDEIEQGWLVISLSTKRTMKRKGQTTPKGRTPLGDKGLGRLSTQKLGHNLEMVTRKDGVPETLHVSFSWSEFTDERSLGTVPVLIRKSVEARKKGTSLVISGLRNADVWRGPSLDTLASDLAQIISPFPEARPFLVTLSVNGTPIDLGQISASAREAAAGKFIVDHKGGNLDLRGKIRIGRLRGQQSGDQSFFDGVVLPNKGEEFYNYLLTQNPPVKLRYEKGGSYFLAFDYSVTLGSLGDIESVTEDSAGKPKLVPADPGPFHGEIDEFVLRGDVVGEKLGGLTGQSEIQQLVRRHAGVKIFRDGFGIRPYGINGEDWLRLGAKQTSGSSWYGLRPNNIIGFVAVSEAGNPQLKDKTDREGLVSNPYSHNFRRLMRQATSTIDSFYEWVRRAYNKYKAEQAPKYQALGGSTKVVADANEVSRALKGYRDRGRAVTAAAASVRSKLVDLAKRIQTEPLLLSGGERKLAELIHQAQYALDQSGKIFQELEAYAADAQRLEGIVASLSPRLDILTDQLQDFAELAGLGILAEALSHEVLNQTDRLSQMAKAAASKARSASPPNTELLIFAEEVTSGASSLRRQIGHLGPSLRYQRDKIQSFPISKVVADVEAHFRERLDRRNLSLRIEPGGSDFDVTTNRGRLIQVVDNLVLNSEYWLTQQRNDGEFAGVINVEIHRPLLRIWDNGLGIDSSVEDNLFEPFVTLKPKERGRGLGLFITRQILESMGCSIDLLHDRNPNGRRYIFQLDFSGIAAG